MSSLPAVPKPHPRARSWHQMLVDELLRRIGHTLPDEPVASPPADRVKGQFRLICEEFFELVEALGFELHVDTCHNYHNKLTHEKMQIRTVGEPDLVAVADACADLDVTTIGMLSEFGINDLLLLFEVDTNNLKKTDPDAGGYLNDRGKFVKPKDHVGPDVAGVLQAMVKPPSGFEPGARRVILEDVPSEDGDGKVTPKGFIITIEQVDADVGNPLSDDIKQSFMVCCESTGEIWHTTEEWLRDKTIETIAEVSELPVEHVVTSLLCCDFLEITPKQEKIIETWSNWERLDAHEWAGREMFHASDNDDVMRIPCPPHVEELRELGG